MPSDVLEFTSNATHMQQVCNKDYEELKSLLDRFQTDKDFLDETGKNAGYYVTSKSGATEKIMNMINF